MTELSDVNKFESYLLNKREFIESMLLIVKEEFSRYCYETELEDLNDIIHHFNLFVKRDLSSGIGVNEE